MGNVFVDAGHTINYYADKWQERWAAPGLSMLKAFVYIVMLQDSVASITPNLLHYVCFTICKELWPSRSDSSLCFSFMLQYGEYF
jgi:hypothetical protein